MKKATLLSSLLAAACMGVILAAPASATSVNVGAPPVLVATPRLVIIPNSPVQYAPGVNFNLFVHSGRYYSFHNGLWFHSPRRGGPWVMVAMDKVPYVVRAVPITYYKIPPGHARKHDKDGSPGRGPKPR